VKHVPAFCLALAVALGAAACREESPQQPATAVPASATSSPAPAEAAEVLLYGGAGGVAAFDPNSGSSQRLGDTCQTPRNGETSRDGRMLAMQCFAPGSITIEVWNARGVTAEHRIDTREEYWPAFSFSPDGSRYAFLTPDGTGFQLEVHSTDVSETVVVRGAEWRYAWSPDSTRIAFHRVPTAPCAPACPTGLGIIELSSGEETTLDTPDPPLAWPRSDAMVVAVDYRPVEFGWEYRAELFDPLTRGRTAIPRLDGVDQYWFSPDGRYVVLLAPAAERIGLEILEIASGTVRAIPGSVISYPSEGIHPRNVRFSDDGYVYWIDSPLPTTTLYRARLDGGVAEKLLDLPGALPETSRGFDRVAYSQWDESTGTSVLWVAAIDGGSPQRVAQGPAAGVYAWRDHAPPGSCRRSCG
jgi:hypothetical protein